MCSARGVHVHVCFNHSLFKWLRGYLFSIHWNLPKTKPTLIDNFSLLFSFFLPFIRIVTTPSAFFPRCLLLWKRCSFVFFYLDECGVFSPKFLYFGSKYHEFQMKLKMAKSIDVCTYGLHTRGHACTKKHSQDQRLFIRPNWISLGKLWTFVYQRSLKKTSSV